MPDIPKMQASGISFYERVQRRIFGMLPDSAEKSDETKAIERR
jgi:hypothetical protein